MGGSELEGAYIELPGSGSRKIKRVLYKRIDKIGRIGVGKDLVGEEVLVIIFDPVLPEDKVKFVKL